MKGKTRLRALKVVEVSLVDQPANQGSRVVLAKRDTAMQHCADCQSKEKCAAAGKCMLKDGMAKNEEREESLTLIKRFAKLLGFNITHSEETVDYSKMTPEELRAELAKRDAAPKPEPAPAPGVTPAPAVLSKADQDRIAKAEADAAATAVDLKKAQETIAKLESREVEREVKRLAKSMLGNAPVDEADAILLLKQVNEDGRKALERIFNKASALVEEGELFTPVGKRGEAAQKGKESLHKVALAKMAQDKTLTYEVAVTAAMEEDPDAYEASLQEQE